jgi:hypothetical protein
MLVPFLCFDFFDSACFVLLQDVRASKKARPTLLPELTEVHTIATPTVPPAAKPTRFVQKK